MKRGLRLPFFDTLAFHMRRRNLSSTLMEIPQFSGDDYNDEQEFNSAEEDRLSADEAMAMVRLNEATEIFTQYVFETLKDGREPFITDSAINEFIAFVQSKAEDPSDAMPLGASKKIVSRAEAWDSMAESFMNMNRWKQSEIHHYYREYKKVWSHKDIITAIVGHDIIEDEMVWN
jgi:hypothetical protein